MSVTVLVADDHSLFRRGLCELIELLPDYQIVAEAASGREVWDALNKRDVDLAMLDINMPGADGMEILGRAKQHRLETRFVMLTMHNEKAYARRAFELGATGYLVKEDSDETIRECLDSVVRGRQYCSLCSLDELFAEESVLLSPAEQRVIYLVAKGKSTAEIAANLSVSVRTIDNHRAHIASKLGLRGPNALLKYAIMNAGKIEQ